MAAQRGEVASLRTHRKSDFTPDPADSEARLLSTLRRPGRGRRGRKCGPTTPSSGRTVRRRGAARAEAGKRAADPEGGGGGWNACSPRRGRSLLPSSGRRGGDGDEASRAGGDRPGSRARRRRSPAAGSGAAGLSLRHPAGAQRPSDQNWTPQLAQTEPGKDRDESSTEPTGPPAPAVPAPPLPSSTRGRHLALASGCPRDPPGRPRLPAAPRAPGPWLALCAPPSPFQSHPPSKLSRPLRWASCSVTRRPCLPFQPRRGVRPP